MKAGADTLEEHTDEDLELQGLDKVPLENPMTQAAESSLSPVPPPRDLVAVAPSEAQLVAWVQLIVHQDERALAALYDATVSRVYGLACRILCNTALAEEVVEDAYFQVWRQAVRFDPNRGTVMAWLLAMTRSRAIDLLRHEARHPQHDSLGLEEAHALGSETPPADDLLDLARHSADLHQALMLLGAQPRQLVSLAFLRGLSHEEIAEQTQLPLGTVKSQIRRALLSLRHLLSAGRPPALAS